MYIMIWIIPALILAYWAYRAARWIYRDMVKDWKLHPITGTFGLVLVALSIIAGVIYPYLDKVQ